MKPHRTDKVSLGFGLVFIVFVVWWLLADQLRISPETTGWLAAGGLILFGTLGLMASLRPRRSPESVSGAPASSEDW